MDKTLVCQGVANQLYKSEGALDVAMTETVALMNKLTEARQELELSMVVTDAASVKIMEAMNLLSQARTAMVQAHGELEEVKLRIGVRTRMIGVLNKPASGGGSQAALTRVA